MLCRVLQGAEGRGGVGDFRGVCSPPHPHPLPTQAGQAAGGPCPCPCPLTPFHLLCFHSEPPSLQLWDRAPRAPSDPPGSASVTAHPSSSLSASPVIFFSLRMSPLFIFNPCESSVLVSVLAVRVGNLITSVSSAERNKCVLFNV